MKKGRKAKMQPLALLAAVVISAVLYVVIKPEGSMYQYHPQTKEALKSADCAEKKPI
jgi:hypothetical protein